MINRQREKPKSLATGRSVGDLHLQARPTCATLSPMPAGSQISVLYVEDDPILRSLFAELIDGRDGITIVGTAADADGAITFARSTRVDVALLDLALGPRSINGAELGLRLRQLTPDMGIVLISQHLMPKFLTTLPAQERHGWAYVQKRGDLSPNELVQIIRATAEGKTILDPSTLDGQRVDGAALDKLTPRQRDVLALLATGRDALGIADELHLAHTTVRRDISNASRVLVPDVGPGYDPRTAAVLEYLRVTRPYDFSDED
jgi:DNA-binding NarL/FixJ family response regulator